jgi:hypothetical protein
MGRGRAKGYAINVPMPEGTSDEEFIWAFDRIFEPVAEAFHPNVVVAVLGVDVLFSDPFSSLQLTNGSIVHALQTILRVSPKLLALGGGGYVRENMARTWTLAWATMNHLGPTEDDFASFGGVFWGDGLSSLSDRSQFLPENVKKKTQTDIQKVVHTVEKTAFPFLKIKPKGSK